MEHKRKKHETEKTKQNKSKKTKHTTRCKTTSLTTIQTTVSETSASNTQITSPQSNHVIVGMKTPSIENFIPNLYTLLDETEKNVQQDPSSVWNVDLDAIKVSSVESVRASIESLINAKHNQIEKCRKEALELYHKTLQKIPGCQPKKCCIPYCDNQEPSDIIRNLENCTHIVCDTCYMKLRKIQKTTRQGKRCIVVSCPICRKKHYDYIDICTDESIVYSDSSLDSSSDSDSSSESSSDSSSESEDLYIPPITRSRSSILGGMSNQLTIPISNIPVFRPY